MFSCNSSSVYFVGTVSVSCSKKLVFPNRPLDSCAQTMSLRTCGKHILSEKLHNVMRNDDVPPSRPSGRKVVRSFSKNVIFGMFSVRS